MLTYADVCWRVLGGQQQKEKLDKAMSELYAALQPALCEVCVCVCVSV